MNLPQINVSTLPDPRNMTGVFGNTSSSGQAVLAHDNIVAMMVYLYDVLKL